MTPTKLKTTHADGSKAAFPESASHPGGPSLVFIYIDMTAPGLSWQNISAVVPDSLERATCLHQAKSGNAILAFRSARAHRGYQRLASYGQNEVMVMMDETTLWGNQLSEHLIHLGFKLHELPVLSKDHESQLLKFLTILAKGSGLHVALQNDATDTPTAESAQIETEIHV